MLVPVLLFLVGFALLIKGGDWFVDGAVGIAHRFHLPELLIGATVVSIGTTLPEVMVSAQAAAEGNAGISYGNAIGSIICNTSLIAALTVAIRPGKVDPKSFRLPTAFFFAAALSYAAVAWTLGRFERWMGWPMTGKKRRRRTRLSPCGRSWRCLSSARRRSRSARVSLSTTARSSRRLSAYRTV